MILPFSELYGQIRKSFKHRKTRPHFLKKEKTTNPNGESIATSSEIIIVIQAKQAR